MVVWWLWYLSAWPFCPPTESTALGEAGRALEEAYDALDVAGFDDHAAQLREVLMCWRRPLTVDDAADLHRWWGLVAITRDEDSTIRGAWAAARQLDPEWRLDSRRWPIGHPVYAAFAEAGAVATDRVVLAPNQWRVDGSPSTTVPRDRSFVLQQLVAGEVVYTGYHQSVASVPKERNVPSGLRGKLGSLWLGLGLGPRWSEQSVSGNATPFGDRSTSGLSLGGIAGASMQWSPKIGSEIDVLAVQTRGVTEGTRVWPTLRAQAHLVGRSGVDAMELVGSVGLGYSRMTVWGWGEPSSAFEVDVPLLSPGLELRRVFERWRMSCRVEGLLASAWRPAGMSANVSVTALMTDGFSLRVDSQARVGQIEALALNAEGRANVREAYAAATVAGEWSW